MSSRSACLSLLLLTGASVMDAQAQAPASQSTSIFNRPAPAVEAALRKRITGFFEAHQQGKWRQAQTFVADDSIDAFLEREKTRYASFEIRDVRMSEGNKEATVTMIVPFEMAVAGVGNIGSAPRPITHHWKLENGEWVWFMPKVDPCAPFDTPVGRITPECKDGKPVGSNAADPEANMQKALENMVASATNKVNPEALQGRVTTNTSQVRLARKTAGEQTVVITNAFDGPVTLELIGGKVIGLTVDFDGASPTVPGRVTVQSKKTATLRLKFQPGENSTPDRIGMQIRVDPLTVMLPIDVLFTN